MDCESAGQDEDLSGERPGNGGVARHIRPVHAGLLQGGDDFAVVRLLEKGVNIGRHGRADVRHLLRVFRHLADIKASRLPKCSASICAVATPTCGMPSACRKRGKVVARLAAMASIIF